MTDILTEIIANTALEVSQRRTIIKDAAMIQAASCAAPAKDFVAALATDGIRIIAECKKQSPSRGLLKKDYDPSLLAQAYVEGGAAAISVLTDEKFFGGSLEDLKNVRSHVDIPVLRKDFIIDAYQIYEARAAGADSFLLLAGVLDHAKLTEFLSLGRSLGMEPLVESHSPDQLSSALSVGAKILGINNRNLKTFEVDMSHSTSQVQRMKEANCIPVCESGIRQADDVRSMAAAGFNCFLVGESVITPADNAAAVAALVKATV